jgi:hypothetical protein
MKAVDSKLDYMRREANSPGRFSPYSWRLFRQLDLFPPDVRAEAAYLLERGEDPETVMRLIPQATPKSRFVPPPGRRTKKP